MLRNGGVVLEFASAEAAAWVRGKAPGAELFTCNLGAGSEVRHRLFKLVVEFVPVRFDPESLHDVGKLERDNGLTTGLIEQVRWLKPVSRRHSAQQVAHLMVAFMEADQANRAIRNGLTILGKCLLARKCLAEPMRCAKCHRFEPAHLAQDCMQIGEHRATCGMGTHMTKDCTGDSAALWYVNCDSDSHTTWDRDCPVYRAQLKKVQAWQLNSGMRFFPTSEPVTWDAQHDGHDDEGQGDVGEWRVVERRRGWHGQRSHCNQPSQLHALQGESDGQRQHRRERQHSPEWGWPAQ
ncbi:hypothetical protein PYCCODRAFT_1364942 [Trametes coccinea BRFM310]|uniref:Uncharacterized protein n=1 Tax=Trametes coccinea (strain BRFM310) TaxID=1353009 RepID=A0A1Y2ISG0_TRAC3|nr:hypothetical protein PYCCODRAFT_1364942 [Trametes coccinea BRFM310]